MRRVSARSAILVLSRPLARSSLLAIPPIFRPEFWRAIAATWTSLHLLPPSEVTLVASCS